jgi:hypothetical protein
MFESIKKVLNQDYDHETPDKPRSIDFSKAYKATVSRLIKPYGLFLIRNKSTLYCGCSAFITDNMGHFVYFNSGDYRYDGNSIYDRILIRSAKSETDYTGGGNQYIELKDIGETAFRIIERIKFCESK